MTVWSFIHTLLGGSPCCLAINYLSFTGYAFLLPQTKPSAKVSAILLTSNRLDRQEGLTQTDRHADKQTGRPDKD